MTDLAAVADHLDAIGKLLRGDGAAPPEPSPPPPIPPPHPLVPTQYADYTAKWAVAEIRPERLAEVQHIAQTIQKYAARYQPVATAVHLTYWPLVGIIHSLESDPPFDFSTHLYNGDLLTARTVHEPHGRPKSGNPPYTWQESAIAALIDEGWDRWTDWSIPGVAYRLELYNGMGYRNNGVPSAYLWAGSTIYEKGKYVADHVWDAEAVSNQIGGMTVLKFLEQAPR